MENLSNEVNKNYDSFYENLNLIEKPVKIPKLPQIDILSYKNDIYLINIIENNTIIKEGVDVQLILNFLKINYNKEKTIFKFPPFKLIKKINIQSNVDIISAKYIEKNEDKIIILNSNEYDGNFSLFINYTYNLNNFNSFFRTEVFYLSKLNYGIPALLTINLTDDYECVNFRFGLFKKNIDNKKQFFWCGIIPNEGLIDYINITYRYGKWKMILKKSFNSTTNVIDKEVTLITPKYFKGGNIIKYINYDITSNINNKNNNKIEENIINEENYKYEIKFNNIKSKTGFFTIETTYINDFNKFYELPYKDYSMLTLQLKDNEKKILIKLKNNILSKDKTNYHNVVKIGKWIYNNIKINKLYSGKKLSINEILKLKQGVCEHFTLLFSGLLTVAGYENLLIQGYALNDKILSPERHAWNIVKLNDKWLPFDPTWGNFTGRIPVTHGFKNFGSDITFVKGKIKVNILPTKESANFILN